MFGRIPPVTKTMLGINIAVFLPLFFLKAQADPAAQSLAGLGTLGDVLLTFALTPEEFWNGAVWQPVTSMFMHLSILHILVNMVGVWSIGMFLERAMGSRRFFGLYMVSGILGGLLVAFFQPYVPGPEIAGPQVTLGASGALLGLLGAIAVLTPNAQLLVFFFPVRARTAALIIGVASVVMAFQGWLAGISHLGHLGGLVGGLLYTWLAVSRSSIEARIQAQRERQMEEMRRQQQGQQRAAYDMFERVMERRSQPGDRSGSPSREKVINPMPGEAQQQEDRYGERDAHGRQRKVHFDPYSGRFYVTYQ